LCSWIVGDDASYFLLNCRLYSDQRTVLVILWGYGFLFRSEIFFRTTRELEYYFFLSRSIFFPEFNIRLYDKNSESDYFVFPPPKSEYFFQQHWESEYYFRKKDITPTPPQNMSDNILSLKISPSVLVFLGCFFTNYYFFLTFDPCSNWSYQEKG
jgi:hypothetical protein